MKDLLPQIFFISIGGYTGSSYQVELKNGKLIYTLFGYGYEKEGEKIFEPTSEQWEKCLKVADEIHIWKWKKRYDDPNMTDGTSWRVNIKINEKEIDSSGSNAFPDGDGFGIFISAVKQLINNEFFG